MLAIAAGLGKLNLGDAPMALGFWLFLHFTYLKPGVLRWRREAIEALVATPLEGDLACHARLRRARIGSLVIS